MNHKEQLMSFNRLLKGSLSRIVLALSFICLATAACGQEQSSLRVMTYNVRHCAGMDQMVDYDRIASVIIQQQPDVVALQELDSMTGRSQQRYQLDELALRSHF